MSLELCKLILEIAYLSWSDGVSLCWFWELLVALCCIYAGQGWEKDINSAGFFTEVVLFIINPT